MIVEMPDTKTTNEKVSMDFVQELLKDPRFSDIISVGDALETVKMASRLQRTRQKHNHPIYFSEKSGYYTDVDITVGDKTVRKKIRKSTEAKLWEALAEVYLDKEKNKTLKDVYAEWIEQHPVGESTIERYRKEWRVYYLNEPISQSIMFKPLCKLTVRELREWAEKLILKNNPPIDPGKKSRLFGIINQCYEFAIDPDYGYAQTNTWNLAVKKINKTLLKPKRRPTDDETQVFTDADIARIREAVISDMITYQKQPTSAGLQILFALQTGLRMGELCGLKWSDIHDGKLFIRRQANNQRVQEHLKTPAGERTIVLTPDALDILDAVRTYNDAHNLHAEWIFQGDNPKYDYRLSYNAADRKLRKLCERLGIVTKSMHKCRKTCLSTLIDAGLSTAAVKKFAGHADIATTEKYYHFDRQNEAEQAVAIAQALAFRAS